MAHMITQGNSAGSSATLRLNSPCSMHVQGDVHKAAVSLVYQDLQGVQRQLQLKMCGPCSCFSLGASNFLRKNLDYNISLHCPYTSLT